MIRLKNLIVESNDNNIAVFTTTPADKYEYKKQNGVWYTKLKTSNTWLDMKKKLSTINYDKAIKTLSKYINADNTVKNDISKPKEVPDIPIDNDETDVNTNKQTELSSDTVILMGGLDYRPGDYNIDQQKSMLKSSLRGQDVIAHRYTDLSGVLNSIKDNPNSPVILFSAGCSYASKIAKAILDKTKLYIVEPYAKSYNTSRSVESAVEKGVPRSNVFTGNTIARGAGVVSGATQTPNIKGGGMASHWNALKVVGKQI